MSHILRFEQVKLLVELSFPEYSKVRSEYWRDVNTAVSDYLSDPAKDDDWFKSTMRAAVEIAFLRAALVAWQDGGGGSELGVSGLAFLTAYKLAEFGFIESLLLSLRVRKYPSTVGEAAPEDQLDEIQIAEISRRKADGYTQGLDILFNREKVLGATEAPEGEPILIFTGDDGMESCFDCQKYKGIKKPASWWIRNNAIPPNRDFECKGYNCFHILQDVKTGKIFTI